MSKYAQAYDKMKMCKYHKELTKDDYGYPNFPNTLAGICHVCLNLKRAVVPIEDCQKCCLIEPHEVQG